MSDYNIVISDSSEFKNENKIECENATLTVKDESMLNLSDFHCSGICTIQVQNSSSLIISKGKINLIKGKITDTSKGVCSALCDNTQVNVSDGSIFSIS